MFLHVYFYAGYIIGYSLIILSMLILSLFDNIVLLSCGQFWPPQILMVILYIAYGIIDRKMQLLIIATPLLLLVIIVQAITYYSYTMTGWRYLSIVLWLGLLTIALFIVINQIKTGSTQ